jgi:hypothetical protein
MVDDRFYGVASQHIRLRNGRKSTDASLRLGAGPSLSDPRPGRGLWRSLYSKSSIHGHSRSTDVAAFPMATCAERLIGSIRRECLDYVVVLGERHLRHVLLTYMYYYNETRTHLSLDKDATLSRTVQRAGRILRLPILGGLHHQYVRI